MSVVTVTFYDGLSGEAASAPPDFELRVFEPGSSQQKPVKMVSKSGERLVTVVDAGIYTVHFTTEHQIVSLHPEEPGDVTMLLLEGEDSRSNFDIFLWDLAPDEETEVPEPIKSTCAYCNERYTTPTSPYYRNTTWYSNCRNNPACT